VSGAAESVESPAASPAGDESLSAAGAGTAPESGAVGAVPSVVVPSVVVASVVVPSGVVASAVAPSLAAASLAAVPSSVERTSSPAAAENAAPATKSDANVTATATRRRREGGLVRALAGVTAASSPSPFSSHSSQARPWRNLLIKEFLRGIAFAPLVGRRGRHFDADSCDFEIPRAVRTDLTIDRGGDRHSPEVGRSTINHQTEGYAVG
jgi:hypothetical protein